MTVYRTKGNRYGWRWKIRTSKDSIYIAQENNHKGYWREEPGRNIMIWGDGLELLKEVLLKEEAAE